MCSSRYVSCLIKGNCKNTVDKNGTKKWKPETGNEPSSSPVNSVEDDVDKKPMT
jgi:hypothetical protein